MAPSLLLFEATNALHRYVAAGILESEEAREALEVILDLGIAFDADPLLHAKALQVAAHFRLPAAYDAHYLALAQANSAELWTADMRLARAVSAELAWVKLLSAEAPEAGP